MGPEVWLPEQERRGGGGLGEAVSDDRGGGGVGQEGAGCGGFVQEVVRQVSAFGRATADGGESGSAGAGGVEKGGYWQPCRWRG